MLLHTQRCDLRHLSEGAGSVMSPWGRGGRGSSRRGRWGLSYGEVVVGCCGKRSCSPQKQTQLDKHGISLTKRRARDELPLGCFNCLKKRKGGAATWRTRHWWRSCWFTCRQVSFDVFSTEVGLFVTLQTEDRREATKTVANRRNVHTLMIDRCDRDEAEGSRDPFCPHYEASSLVHVKKQKPLL